ncbi:MAG: C39 family peptidase [Gammaproteobacteria bacterium]
MSPPHEAAGGAAPGTHLGVQIEPQPDLRSCGATCLHSIYRFYGLDLDLHHLAGSIEQLASGGTLDVFLACDALRRGFQATIHTYNLQVFDPTWFDDPDVDIGARLEAQMRHKRGIRLTAASRGYQEFLRLGGRLRFVDLTRRLLRDILNRGSPIITGLSATYLYRTMREVAADDTDDDVRGTPAGHFVVLSGYDRRERTIRVSDPLEPNPLSGDRNYWIHIDRVIGAILLGVLTHDANLLVIRPT